MPAGEITRPHPAQLRNAAGRDRGRSYSGGNETECVETAVSPLGASVRDSKRPHEGRFHIRAAAWADFIGAVREGDLS
ncbi:DUF397 domain-containing protein [Streptomyces sp. NPDC056452]|uniref:DUF397 domain-containing protein n=1 Tax=Streptomyces sp. NPDC056452 TaxID=3345821 RepID=UPI0036B63351